MKKVFLDLGANTGQSVDYFRQTYEGAYRLDKSVIGRSETNEFEIHFQDLLRSTIYLVVL